jgi:multiple sugar transport system substrate-binding protein
MKFKRTIWVSAFAGACLLVVGLAACSSNGGDSDEKVSLRFAGWDQPQEPIMQELIVAFEKENPNISVTYENTAFASYSQKMQVQASAGDAPDVFWVTAANHILYASEGLTANIDEMLEKDDMDLSNYSDASIAQVTYDGSVYGFPRSGATSELWYNKELFDAAGVEYPTDEWDWEDMQEAAAQLTDPAAGVWGMGALLDGTQSYLNTIPAAGGSVLSEDGKSSNFSNPKTCAGVAIWHDMIDDGVMPTYSQMLESPPSGQFQSGKMAMLWAGAWYTGVFAQNPEIAEKIDVAPLPKGPEGRVALLTANAYAMYADSKHPEAAWKFLSFIGSPEGAAIQGKNPLNTQPAEEAAAELWASNFPQYNMSAITEAPASSVPHPQTKLTGEWITKIKDGLISTFNLEVEPQEACDAVSKEIDAVLAKENG